jgi:tetrapyrrole methylase family protein / MazG family protein
MMKANISVVTLGPGDPSLMTLQTAELLQNAQHLVLRTERHGVSAWLKEKQIGYETLDSFYDQYEDFSEMHDAMARKLWDMAASAPLTYAVMDASTDGSVTALAHTKPEDAVLTCYAGLSTADACLSAVPAEKRGDGVRILSATDCVHAAPDPRTPLMITEINDRILAGEVKLWLDDLYADEMEIVFFAPTEKALRKAKVIPLEELDRQKKYDHTCCVYVPAAPFRSRQRFCFEDLKEIMGILRGEDGCPWDCAQTHETLRPYLIEEAWEAVGAIDEQDSDHLADELGDVLLQVVFHASIGESHGTFSLSDITTDICRKMIYRHAHIFGDAHCRTPGEVSANWEELKKAEKGLNTQADVLRDVSIALPSLMHAAKVQKKAAQVGFDWDTPEEALPKVHEEAEEVLEELKNGRDPGEELGDLLFSCVNVARLSGKEPELLLRSATKKFITRFDAMEKLIISDGKALKHLTLDEMDVYWKRVKSAQNS